MIQAKFHGGADIAAKLANLSARLNKRVTRDALYAGGLHIRDRASRLAPRRRPAPDMADNIDVATARAQRGEMAAVKVGPTTDHFYAFFVEHGTVHMSAQPFMRPGFEQEWRNALETVREAFWTELAAVGQSRSVSVPTMPEAPDGGDLL